MVEQPQSDARRLSGLGWLADVSIPRAEDFAAAAREWFAEVPGAVAPDEWEEVLREAKPPFRGKPQAVWPDYDYQEPFMLWADIVLAPAKWRGMRVWQRRVNGRNLSWLADELAARPVSATVRMFRVDAEGMELPGGLAIEAEAALDAADTEIPVARLSYGETLSWRPGWPAGSGDGDAVAGRVADLARRWAGRPGVIAMFAGEDVNSGGPALERSLFPARPWWDVARSGHLEGYAWLTLCPAGLAGRVGGAAGLAATGAFSSVQELPGGAVLAQATERAGEYGMEQARAVFCALAPVLPAGLPEQPANWPDGVPWLVVPEDAAAWRA